MNFGALGVQPHSVISMSPMMLNGDGGVWTMPPVMMWY